MFQNAYAHPIVFIDHGAPKNALQHDISLASILYLLVCIILKNYLEIKSIC